MSYDHELPNDENSQQEIAAGVDASSAVARNADMSAFHSALKGQQYSMINNHPAPITTTVTGGGSVSFVNSGADVSAGATSGDTAELQTLYRNNLDVAAETRLWLLVRAPPGGTWGTTTTDRIEIGLVDSSATHAGLYYRSDTAELVIKDSGGTIRDSVSVTSNRNKGALEIVKSEGDSTNRITLWGGNSKLAEATYNNIPIQTESIDLVRAVSAGGGESTVVTFAIDQTWEGGDKR